MPEWGRHLPPAPQPLSRLAALSGSCAPCASAIQPCPTSPHQPPATHPPRFDRPEHLCYTSRQWRVACNSRAVPRRTQVPAPPPVHPYQPHTPSTPVLPGNPTRIPHIEPKEAGKTSTGVRLPLDNKTLGVSHTPSPDRHLRAPMITLPPRRTERRDRLRIRSWGSLRRSAPRDDRIAFWARISGLSKMRLRLRRRTKDDQRGI
jgi:hypothetical protein